MAKPRNLNFNLKLHPLNCELVYSLGPMCFPLGKILGSKVLDFYEITMGIKDEKRMKNTVF
jgi:hypothetical protein